MALPVKQQVTIWGSAAAVFLLLMWFLGQVLLPFIVGGAIAYVLDPLADRLEARGFTRVWATVVIFLLSILIFLAAMLLVLPTLVAQIIALIEAAPGFYETVRDVLIERFPSLIQEDSTARQTIADIIETARSQIGGVVSSVVSSAGSVMNSLVVLVVSPVVAFYLLLDWDRMVAGIDDLLPRDHAPVLPRVGH